MLFAVACEAVASLFSCEYVQELSFVVFFVQSGNLTHTATHVKEGWTHLVTGLHHQIDHTFAGFGQKVQKYLKNTDTSLFGCFRI